MQRLASGARTVDRMMNRARGEQLYHCSLRLVVLRSQGGEAAIEEKCAAAYGWFAPSMGKQRSKRARHLN